MKKAILCQGVGMTFDVCAKLSEPLLARDFLPWLQQKYILAGVNAQNPSFPNCWIPARNYPDDVSMFSHLEIDEDTRLVGYSCGGGFLLKYLSENKDIKVRHLVLVAPWLDPKEEMGDYFKGFELDRDLPNRIGKIDLLYSENDWENVNISIEKIKAAYPGIALHNCGERGHFRVVDAGMGTKEFPELWEICRAEV